MTRDSLARNCAAKGKWTCHSHVLPSSATSCNERGWWESTPLPSPSCRDLSYLLMGKSMSARSALSARPWVSLFSSCWLPATLPCLCRAASVPAPLQHPCANADETPCAPAHKRGVILQQQHTSCQETFPCSSCSKSLCIRGPRHCQDEPWHHSSLESKCLFPVSITQPNSSRLLITWEVFTYSVSATQWNTPLPEKIKQVVTGKSGKYGGKQVAGFAMSRWDIPSKGASPTQLQHRGPSSSISHCGGTKPSALSPSDLQ